MEKINTMWISIVCLAFVVGLWAGYVLHQEHMFKGMVEVARGLEGTNFEINIDVNETLIVDRTMGRMKEFGVFNFTNSSLNSS